MVLEFIDKISAYVPTIKPPAAPLSLREKMVWTAGVLVVYFLLYSTVAIGVSQQAISNPTVQLISIVFAGKIGSVITVGIGPIVLASIVLQLAGGSGLFKFDMTDPVQKARYQTIQKLAAIGIGVVEGIIYVMTGFVPLSNPSLFWIVALQLVIGAITIIFLDEILTKYGIMSGINIFIASGVSYSIVAGTIQILVPGALAAFHAGGASALPNMILAFGPLIFAVIVFLVSIYAYETKVELPLAFEQLRGIGGRLPIPFLYVSVLPVILATSLELSLQVWFRFLAGVTGSFATIAKFIAFYQPSASGSVLTGGLLYLISPSFPTPYPAPYGIGGYGAYFNYLLTAASQLYLPWGGIIFVPETIHILIYVIVLIILCVIFGKFWIEMTGQSPKNMAEQIGEMGWQIPGFRRDPRIIENVLNKYIPTVTILGSIFVGLLAALANLTGAIGSGMGILLTVGIIYMLYQQLEQEKIFDTYPILNKIVK
jgi:preprotein translocase subunit SecY